MTKMERLKIYEAFFHKVNMAMMAQNNGKVRDALGLIDAWSYAHRAGNGEPTDYEQKKMVENVINQMRTF